MDPPVDEDKNLIEDSCNSSDEFCSVSSLLGSSSSSLSAPSVCGLGQSGCETDMSEEIADGFSRIKDLVTELLDADETKSKIKLEENERFVKDLLKKFHDTTTHFFKNGGSGEKSVRVEHATDVNSTSYLSDEEAEEMFAEMASFTRDDTSLKTKLAIYSSSASSSPSSGLPPSSMSVPIPPVMPSSDMNRRDLPCGSTASSAPCGSPAPSSIGDPRPPVVISGKSRYEQIRDDIIAERNEQLQAMGFFDEFAAVRSEMVPKKPVGKAKVKAKRAVERSYLRRSERLFLSSSENEEKVKSGTQAGEKNISAIIEGILSSVVCKKQKLLESEPFLCKQCGKRFGIKSNLNRHEREVHGKVFSKDFVCKTCGKRYESRCSLSRHSKKQVCVAPGTISEKSISCDKCDFKTKHMRNMRRHKQKAHKQSKEYKCDDYSYMCQITEDLQVPEGLAHKHPGVTRCYDESDLESIDIFTDDSGDDDTQL